MAVPLHGFAADVAANVAACVVADVVALYSASDAPRLISPQRGRKIHTIYDALGHICLIRHNC
jgi:hypothetical protein